MIGMRKPVLSAVLLLLFLAPAAAEVQYTGDIGEDRVMLNTSIKLECSDPCPVSRWGLTWTLPENAEIIEIRDSLGEIDDYERSGRSVSITTNTGEPRRTETVRIRMRIEKDAEEVYGDLHYRKLSLPSLSGEETTGVFHTDDMISGWVGYDFQSSFQDDEFRFQGEGPTNIRVNFGEGMEKEFYEFFGEDRDNSSEAYRVAVGTTGMVQQFRRFPVSVMPPARYNQTRPSWSSGEYMGGNIALRNNLGEDYLPVLTHETVHGLNDRFLRWDQTRSSYIDEGVAEHAEYLIRKKLYRNDRSDTGTRQIFGEDEEYRVREGRDTYVYTLRSQGDRDELWNYYRNDRDFMKSWNPGSSAEFREFGYAYSELMIKNYIVNQGTVRQLYSQINPDRQFDSPEQKWSYLSQYMDMTPCKYDSRQQFDRCLDDINSHDYTVYSASSIEHSQGSLEFDELKLPNRTVVEERNRTGVNSATSFVEFLSGFFDYILSLLGRP